MEILEKQPGESNGLPTAAQTEGVSSPACVTHAGQESGSERTAPSGQASGSGETHLTKNVQGILLLMARFHEAQSQRAAEYSKLSSSFQQMLANSNEEPYRIQLAASTGAFQACSSAVRQVISGFEAEPGCSDLVELLRSLQSDEQSKLRFTLILQALRKADAEGRFSWQQPAAPDAVALAQQSVIGHAAGHSCSSHAPEPTEDEFTNAVREATQELQASTYSINEALDELRYAETELREQLERC